MTLKLLLISLLTSFSFLVKAQLGNFAKERPIRAQWDLSSKKINDCEYDLIFTVTLEKDWHTFSVTKIKDAEGEVFPTSIVFKPNASYTLVGNLTETKPTPEYDKTIKKTVLIHYKKAVFTQRIKLSSSAKTKISGNYQCQVCNNAACETPPSDKFDFDLQGSVNCKK